MNQPDADCRADWMAVHVLGHLREAFANPLSHFATAFSRLVSVSTAENSSPPSRPTKSDPRIDFRAAPANVANAVADRVAKTIVDQFESVKIDRQNSGWSRIVAVALGEQRSILQKCAAICDPGERVDHGSSAVAEFCAHRKQDKGT
jgi:hypothetical protein